MIFNPLDILIITGFLILLFFSIYNLSIIFIGVGHFLRQKEKNIEYKKDGYYPFFSLIIPMRNEERVAGSPYASLYGYVDDHRESAEAIVQERNPGRPKE